MTAKTDIEQLRADFEAWTEKAPVITPFASWKAGYQAALQSQDRDVVPYRCVAQAAHGLLGSAQYERLMEAIDHARRVGGDGE